MAPRHCAWVLVMKSAANSPAGPNTGAQPGAQRYVDMILDQVDDPVAEHETHIDVRIRLEEIRQDRNQVKTAKTEPCSDN
jgi:hypothetical protein